MTATAMTIPTTEMTSPIRASVTIEPGTSSCVLSSGSATHRKPSPSVVRLYAPALEASTVIASAARSTIARGSREVRASQTSE